MDYITGFGNLEENYLNLSNAKIVILPVPFDGTSTWIKGADEGPEAIIEASANIELYDIETEFEVYKKGIYTDKPITEKDSSKRMIRAVYERVESLLNQGKFIVTIGGEHSISIGAIEAHTNYYKDITVLQLDAHADLRNTYNESRFNHSCVMRRVKEFCPIVQVGIRSLDVSEIASIEKDRIFYAQDILYQKNWIDEVITKISSKVYISIDLDVFDISIMPATGTPEPGGLTWYDVLFLLKKITEEKELVGFDVVELCPSYTSKPYDYLAAKLIYKLLSYKFKNN